MTRTRLAEGGVELHVTGATGCVPRVVERGRAGRLRRRSTSSVAEPTLETVFINLTGKELRD